MENQPEQNPPAVNKTPISLHMPLAKVIVWVKKHGTSIQTVAAIVQAFVAALMCLSLIQGCRAIQVSHEALLITQRQLESTIEPRIDIVYGSPAPIQVATPPNASGVEVAITNISVSKSQIETFVTSCTNFTRVNFKNQGVVSVANLELLMAIEIATDESSNVKKVLTDDSSELIVNCLKPNTDVWHDFGNHPAIERLVSFQLPESGRRAVCFVVKYNRAVDMKPEIRYIFFLNGNVTGITNAFAMPFSPKTRTLNMNAEAIEIRERFKAAARQVVEQMDPLGINAN